ncbi:MAG: cbb3-type cytochrome c oxidase subunit I [Microthrixaceae bacterium]|nr:cbb3-type cytochrome c oxidase subunit I [Microthrixaceae bacterium]
MAVTETPPETVAAAATESPAPRREATGLAAVLGSGDHKTIGRLFIVTSLIFGLAIVTLGALFSYERIEPTTLDLFSDGSVLQLFTLWRLGGVFLVAFPLVIGVAMVVVPLQVGSATIAFPRAAAASYWAWLVGAALVLTSYAMDGGPGGSSRTGVNLFLAAMILVLVAILVAAICLATTVIALRTTGLRLALTPLYAWSVAVAAIMWLLTLPVLVGSLVLAYVDHRHAGGTLGGNAAIFGRFAWVLRNPQIYVIAIPVLGFAADVMATTTRARVGARALAQGSIAGAGVTAFGAVLASPYSGAFDSPVVVAMGLAAVLPVLAMFGLVGDLFRRGNIRLTSGATYALGSAGLLLLATLAGALGSIPALETAGTVFDLGVTHLTIVAAITAALGGIHWWATKIGGQPANDGLGRLVPIVLMAGAALAAIPDLASGLTGEGVELAQDWTGGIEGLNLVSMVGTVVVLLGLVLAVVSLLPVGRKGTQAPRDPWDGQTLEWLTASPPPIGNFDSALPVVKSAEPLIDLREEK